MKTAQDSYTITIKQIVRLQERMHLEKFQVDKLDHYYEYETKCDVSGEDAFLKLLTQANSKWPPIGHHLLSHC